VEKMETQNNKGSALSRSVLTGIGTAVLYLLLGTVLDYIVTQVLSQFFIANCSEDCYFRVFDAIFILVVSLSLAGGIRSGVRVYKRRSEKA
jgi:hypothetical protein